MFIFLAFKLPTMQQVFFQEIGVYAFFLIYRVRQNHAGPDRRKMMPDPPDYRIAISTPG